MRIFEEIDCMKGIEKYRDLLTGRRTLAIVDPPYGIGDTFIGFSTGAVKGKLERLHKETTWDDSIPDKEYFDELKRVSKQQIIWGANYFNCFSGGALVWYKNRGGYTLSQCEIASVSGQNKVDYVAIQVLTGFVSNEERIHPTQKPITLYRWLLENYANPGDLILDTHVGSASSLIACEALGFDYVGFEIDKDYYETAKKRIEEWRSLPLFDEPGNGKVKQPEQLKLIW
jgi:site-specific DNA-methyltransferase (adenine-specific)